MVTQYKVGEKVFLRDARRENLPPHPNIYWSSSLAHVVGFPATIVRIDNADASAKIDFSGGHLSRWVSLDWISSLEVEDDSPLEVEDDSPLETVADSPVIEEIDNESLFW